MSAWTEHVAKWKDCTNCPLCQQRDQICLARGSLPADIVFIGEAPGASEDAIGQPFKGPAGKLLDQIIERAYSRVIPTTFTNLVACFPREAKERGDNEPEREEIEACHSRLVEFINIAQPKLIVCVGALATKYVNHDDNVRCVDIVHPAAIIRMPLAQQQMAVQKSIVVLRNAVEDMLNSNRSKFTKWGDNNASSQSHHHISTRKQLRQAYDDSDIPF